MIPPSAPLSARQAVRQAYDELGATADRERVEAYRLGKTVELVGRACGGYAGKRVLELGPSVGIHLVAAAKLGAAQCVGLDKYVFAPAAGNPFSVDPEALERVRRVWSENGIQILPCDVADRFPVDDASMDLVVANAVIEHCHGIHKHLFSEAFRVLKPGGCFVITTPNLASLLKRLRMLLGRSPLWDLKDYYESGTRFTGHAREFTVPECRRMLEWSGFRVRILRAQPGYYKRRWFKQPRKWPYLILHALARFSARWGDLIYAVGEKPRA